jgi:hypothetical protein
MSAWSTCSLQTKPCRTNQVNDKSTKRRAECEPCRSKVESQHYHRSCVGVVYTHEWEQLDLTQRKYLNLSQKLDDYGSPLSSLCTLM